MIAPASPRAACLVAVAALLLAHASNAIASRAEPTVVGQQSSTAVATTQHLAFHVDPWISLHHFLYQWARADEGLGIGREEVAVPERDDLGALTATELQDWSESVTFYRTIAARSLFDDDLLTVKQQLLDLDGDPAASPPDGIPGIAAALASAMPVYETRWWPRHQGVSSEWVAAVMPMLRRHERAWIETTRRIYGAQWPATPIRVDVSAYANTAAGYTAIGHTVMFATDPGSQGTYGVEMVLHEVQHTREVGGAAREGLQDAFAAAGIEAPRNLWHALIFATAGELAHSILASEGLPEQPAYWIKEGFESFRGWGPLIPIVQRDWLPVVRGEATTEEGFATLVASVAALMREGAAYPRFDRALLLESTSETSANISFGDLDGDGTLDIVLAKGRHWPLVSRVLLGDGKGGIADAYDLGTIADRTYSGQLADLDGDGDLDVVISNDRPDAKLVYLNGGAGEFAVGSSYGDPEWPTRNASVADVDGDGFPDIIVANRGRDGANFVCFNDGAGTFDAACTAFSSEPATTITPADFNGNGRVDLAVPHRNGGQSVVYLAGADTKLANRRAVPFGPPDAAFRVAAAADLDNDGSLDIVASDERRGVFAYFGNGGESFSPGLMISDGAIVPYALAVADLNGDGAMDIVVGNAEAPSTIHFNDGSGRGFTARRFGDDQGVVYGFAIGDLDGDGLVDIGVARSDAPNVVYFADRAPGR